MAIPKLEKPKLARPTTADVNCNINPLITILNNPSVNSVIGQDSNTKNGLIAAFKMARIKLAINAIQILAM
jgi:hypothetical protein